MAFNHCMRLAPRMGRHLAAPQLQQARSIFSPFPRPTDIGALIRDMDRQMDRLERQMFRSVPSWLPRLPRAAALPIDHTLGPQEGGSQYRLSLDLAGFKPEEISLSLDETGRQLTISARCERKGQDGSRYAQEMVRSVTLPETIDVQQLSSLLHSDGVLAIEAPFKEQPPQPESEPKAIPIQRVGEQKQQEQLQDKQAEQQASS
ncbi:Heat shock protein Hsp16-1-like [Frankliniella occidentalis]|uniref:Heat shock protein Hsp-16.1/Hsp-16.11-like n=1 Tax=Frankliniella occidentalis TaxID=133901 RepID=A0A6J1T7D0_FRAOC|nr:heat shock protein Hsp-16.1/Hsp-16.11-like [Frankliniella occidentalis]KAE8748991.1 Heat shock protein Hsp16-1-like [Frankliniella occidentalis]